MTSPMATAMRVSSMCWTRSLAIWPQLPVTKVHWKNGCDAAGMHRRYRSPIGIVAYWIG